MVSAVPGVHCSWIEPPLTVLATLTSALRLASWPKSMLPKLVASVLPPPSTQPACTEALS